MVVSWSLMASRRSRWPMTVLSWWETVNDCAPMLDPQTPWMSWPEERVILCGSSSSRNDEPELHEPCRRVGGAGRAGEHCHVCEGQGVASLVVVDGEEQRTDHEVGGLKQEEHRGGEEGGRGGQGRPLLVPGGEGAVGK